MSRQRRFIVVTCGSMGDVHPFLGLAVALKSRGHRVSFLTNEVFRDMATQAGLDFHPIGTLLDVQSALNNPDLWHPRKGLAVVWHSCATVQKPIVEFIASQPDAAEAVVIAHPLALPGASTARDRIGGLKLVTAWLAPANLRTCHDPMLLGPLRIPRWVPYGMRRWLWQRVDADILDPLTLPDINALRADYGLDPVKNYATLLYEAADFGVTLFPAWFDGTPPDWPVNLLRGEFLLFDGFAEQTFSDELQQFLDAGDPPIVFTFGSAMQHAGKAFKAALDACQQLQRRAIFLTLFPAQLPAHLPPGVKWFEYVPFCKLLPHVAAVVHHGGIGSTAEALRAGLPQIVVPMAFDQFDNAARVEAMGVGFGLPQARLNRRSLRRRLAMLLGSESILENCRRAAAYFNNPDPSRLVAEMIEDRLG
ncbi:MAG: glycosyltransferase [Sterolibacterium sp.]